jgi:hypothetical protein
MSPAEQFLKSYRRAVSSTQVLLIVAFVALCGCSAILGQGERVGK